MDECEITAYIKINFNVSTLVFTKLEKPSTIPVQFDLEIPLYFFQYSTRTINENNFLLAPFSFSEYRCGCSP